MPINETALAIGIAKKITALLSGKVIEKWRSYRAEQFILGLINSYKNESEAGINKVDLDTKLEELVENPKNSEVLFENYRRVVLAASKEIGPRIIGLLTARIIHEKRQPTVFEDQFLMAAESLNDGELKSFYEFFNEHKNKCLGYPYGIDPNETSMDPQLRVLIDAQDETIEYGSRHLGSASFPLLFGAWAQKLKNIGILREEIIRDRQLMGFHLKGSKSGIKSTPGISDKITWWLVIETEYFDFIELIDRAQQAYIATNIDR